jgi:ribonuclease P protein component
MPKMPTLRLNKEFKTAYYWGKSAGGSLLVSYVRQAKRLPGGVLAATRYGITAGKKVGGAVQRNRARRLIREAYRLLVKEGRIRPGLDIVFVARADCVKAMMPQVQRQMRGQLDKLGAMRK